jgi:hypothetical protein
MRSRFVLFLSALVATFSLAAASSFASAYHDGRDRAVDTASPDLFRLDPDTLEPGCDLAGDLALAGHIDIGDDVGSTHVFVPTFATEFSIDQVLVPGAHSGYRVYNTFDTGSVNNDPDIDPTQSATNLEPLPGDDDVDVDGVIVCVSDHEDSGQNEPYVADGLPGEVAAVNRPIIQPTLAALGVSAVSNLHTYKLGFGYSIERWYAPHRIADSPPFTLDLTDPMGSPFGFTHVYVPTRVEQPGVLRINDIDDFGESFDNPHSEQADHGQPVVFNQNGDAQAYLHNSLNPDGSGRGPWGLLTFTTQGDLPISWTVKSSLAPEAYSRSVEVTDDFLRDWEADWQAYYRGEGPKPTLPLAPGTNAPAPLPGVIVNVPPAPPAPPARVTNNTTVQPAAVTVVQTKCVSGKVAKIKLAKKARKGNIQYVGKKGLRTVKAHKSHGRLRARADFRGVTAEPGTYSAVRVREKMKSGWRESSRLFKLCG